MAKLTLKQLRERLVAAFAPEFRIIGNTMQSEIVAAIDDAMNEIADWKRRAEELGKREHGYD